MLYIKTPSPKHALKLATHMVKVLGVTLANLDAYIEHMSHHKTKWNTVWFDDLNHQIAMIGSPSQDKPTISTAQFLRQYKPPAPFEKSTPALLIGFEIEGCVAHDARTELISYLGDLYEVDGASLIDADGSIRPKATSIEIVTPPLAAEQAFEKLEWLLSMLTIMSEEGLFSTNHTCGLHVNISERSSFRALDHEPRKRFALSFLQTFDPMKWKKAYRRVRGKSDLYCQWPYGAPKTIEDLSRKASMKHVWEGTAIRPVYSNHHAAVNTEHLDKKPDERRIEVRVVGGKDYHADHEKLSAFILDIEQAACQAYQSI